MSAKGSELKRVRQTRKANLRNKSYKSAIKTAIKKVISSTDKAEDIVLYPIVNRDLNFIMDNSIELAQVCTTIKNVNQSLLKEVVPVDVFESKELKNEKSVLFKLYFQNPKKTLEDNEVTSIIAEIIDIVLKKFNAKLRDQ